MPFAYYGAKHKLAKLYPPPAHPTIVEPFAGSAAYSCHWGQHVEQVILVEKNPYVVDLWRRLQRMTAAEVDAAVAAALASPRTAEPLVTFCGGGSSVRAYSTGRPNLQVTPRMRKDAPSVAARVKRTLPYMRHWQIIHADYLDAPNITATWYVDPPYQPVETRAGMVYADHALAIDYPQLATWCQQRQGQVIVCEQHPARWLPFTPLADQVNAAGSAIRTETMWHRP